jgi:hypothetical protein
MENLISPPPFKVKGQSAEEFGGAGTTVKFMVGHSDSLASALYVPEPVILPRFRLTGQT